MSLTKQVAIEIHGYCTSCKEQDIFTVAPEKYVAKDYTLSCQYCGSKAKPIDRYEVFRTLFGQDLDIRPPEVQTMVADFLYGSAMNRGRI